MYAEAARQYQAITENPVHLQRAHQKLLRQQAKSNYLPS